MPSTPSARPLHLQSCLSQRRHRLHQKQRPLSVVLALYPSFCTSAFLHLSLLLLSVSSPEAGATGSCGHHRVAGPKAETCSRGSTCCALPLRNHPHRTAELHDRGLRHANAPSASLFAFSQRARSFFYPRIDPHQHPSRLWRSLLAQTTRQGKGSLFLAIQAR